MILLDRLRQYKGWNFLRIKYTRFYLQTAEKQTVPLEITTKKV